MTSRDKDSGFIHHLDKIGTIMSACALILMIILSLLIFYDALMRSFGYPTIWVFETSLYSFIFIGFIGNALAVKRKAHFRVIFLADIFPRLRRTLDFISDASILLFGVLLTASGIYFTHYLWTNSVLSSSLLETPMWIPSLAIPLGGLGMILQTVVSMLSRSAVETAY